MFDLLNTFGIILEGFQSFAGHCSEPTGALYCPVGGEWMSGSGPEAVSRCNAPCATVTDKGLARYACLCWRPSWLLRRHPAISAADRKRRRELHFLKNWVSSGKLAPGPSAFL